MQNSGFISDFKGRSNNLGFLKIIAALLVIFSHSWSITGTGTDPFYIFNLEQMTFGALSVTLFFFASGFFIAKSLMKGKTGKEFWKGRLIRIYPAFIVVMLLTVFVMGPVLTVLPLKEYFMSSKTWSYFLYLLMIPRYQLPGVLEDAPLSMVNGALWTLVLEMICYAGIYIVCKLKWLNQKSLKVINCFLIPAELILLIIQPKMLYAYNGYYRPLFIFIAGAEFCVYADQIPLKTSWMWISILCGFILGALHRLDLYMVFGFPYVLSCLVFAKKQVSDSLGSLGDYSYSIYLAGMPVQQTVQHFFPGSAWFNAGVSIVIASAIGFLFYRLVEVPSVRYFSKK